MPSVLGGVQMQTYNWKLPWPLPSPKEYPCLQETFFIVAGSKCLWLVPNSVRPALLNICHKSFWPTGITESKERRDFLGRIIQRNKNSMRNLGNTREIQGWSWTQDTLLAACLAQLLRLEGTTLFFPAPRMPVLEPDGCCNTKQSSQGPHSCYWLHLLCCQPSLAVCNEEKSTIP